MIYTQAFVTLAAPQWDRSIAFYSQLLAQEPEGLQTDRYGAFDLGGWKLAIYRPKLEEQEPPAAYPTLSLCFQVPNLDETLVYLATLNMEDPGPIQQVSHGREVYLYDPDGNRIILYEPRK
ncbi:MAG: VOC family protein [Alkalinema sp. RU_4_3]|nr:VOC family protein [Alkalinema sp. RU_4_3]